MRDISLRLKVVVVADEIADRIVWEQLAELFIELGRERLVMANDQRGPLHPLDHVRHRECLAGPGRAQQRLIRLLGANALDEGVDSPRLISGRLELADKIKSPRAVHADILGPGSALLGRRLDPKPRRPRVTITIRCGSDYPVGYFVSYIV